MRKSPTTGKSGANSKEGNMDKEHLLAKRSDYRTSHVLHLILSIITLGLWIPVWMLCGLSNSIEKRKIDRKLERMAEGKHPDPSWVRSIKKHW
jgi:hypothetical protein